MNKNFLGKGIVILILLTVIVSFSGCRKKEAADPAGQAVENNSQEGKTAACQEKETGVLENTESSEEEDATAATGEEEQEAKGKGDNSKETSTQKEEFKIELKEGEQVHFE